MLILRELNENDEAAFLKGLENWEGEDHSPYSFNWKPGMTYKDLLSREKNDSQGIGLPTGFVPATMFYGFVDGMIVGRLNIRHQLNEYLRNRGGHIGYAVAPPFRKRGYATEMFKQSLPLCRNLGITEILITCADDNTPSWKIIEKFGGVLEGKTYDIIDKETIRRYWIKLGGI